jgi:hypothetical protein
MGGTCGTNEAEALIGFSEGPERNRRLGKRRRGWKNDIKIGLKEREQKGAEWIVLAQDRYKQWAVVNAVMSLTVPKNAGNFWTR